MGRTLVATNDRLENGSTPAARAIVVGEVRILMTLGKVLILSASAGAGHLRAAEAIERAIAATGAAESVRHVDVLDYTNALFRRLYSEAYLEMVERVPDVVGWFYDYSDDPEKDDTLESAFDKLNTRPFVRMIGEFRPDVAICTHFLPAEIISWLTGQGHARDPAGDRRHRLRHPRPVALRRTTRTTSSRSTRPAPTSRSWACRRPRSPSPASRSTRPSPRRRTATRCARNTASAATGP